MATETPQLRIEGRLKFWTILAGIILGVSVLVMLIDMSIKAAILEESAKLRRVILGERERQEPGNPPDNTEHHFDASIPGNLLVPANPRMGTPGSNNGHKATDNARRTRRSVSPRDFEIPPGDKRMGTQEDG